MYAVIKTGGKQYKVSEGDVLTVEKLDCEPGQTIELADVLMIVDGENVAVGAPYLAGARVSATVTSHGRGAKVRIVKFRRRKHYRRRMGHRQHYTELQVTGIARGA